MRGRWKFVRSASTRRNANPGVMKSSVLPFEWPSAGEGLDDPRRRRPDRQDALGGVDPCPRTGIDPVPLPMDHVLLEGRLGEWPERVEPDVERHGDVVDPLEQRATEVEAGRRRGGRAGVVRKDGLVPLGIRLRLVDVRRQRHLAVRLAREPHEPAAVAQLVHQLRRRRVAADGPRLEPFPCAQAPGRACERLPDAVLPSLEQEDLDVAARLPPEEEPRRDDARVVHDDEMAVELVGEVAERSVADRSARAVEHEEARRVPRLDGVLRDQVARQVVVELV